VLLQVSFLCESLSTRFTVYCHWCLHDFHNVCSTNLLVCLKLIFPNENFVTLFTLKLDFKVNSFVSSKGPFGKIQVTDIALFGFMDFCHVLSQDVCSVESLFTASAL